MKHLYVIIATLFLCTGSMNTRAIPQQKETIKKQKETKIASPRVGDKMPNFIFEDAKGKKISLKSLRGKYVLIDVWASWCSACENESPYLERLEDELHHKNITFVCISVDKKRKAWERALTKRSRNSPILQWISPEGEDAPILKAFGIEAIPRFILLDKKGKIVDMQFKFPSDPEIKNTLLKLKGI